MEKHPLLLKATDIAAMPGDKRVHFLNPNAVRLNKSLGDAVGLSQIGVHIITVQPGHDSTETHKHYYEEECVYVLSGKGTAIIDGERYAIAAGDFLGLPTGRAAHNIVNDAEAELVCLVMGQRLEQDVADYPEKGKRIYRYGGQWDLVDIDNISEPRRIFLPPESDD